ELSNNFAGINGGGLHISGTGDVTFNQSRIRGNTADSEGGGLWNSGAGTLMVSESTVSGNQATFGGGVFQDGSGGTTTISASTISGNTASGNTGMPGGGGVMSEGGTLNVTTSTISGNNSSGAGGGLLVLGGTATIASSTIANNMAGGNGGGVRVDGGTATATNTIIATNSATGSGPDISGTLNSGDYNLIGNTSGATITGTTGNNVTGVDPMLGPLTDNGGPTRTHALLTGSPAIDAGTNAGLSTDQRGVPRPQGNDFDIGAFETGMGGVEFDADDGNPGDANDGEGDEFVITYDPSTDEFVITINGVEADRVEAGSENSITINGSNDRDTITLIDTSNSDERFFLFGRGGRDTINVIQTAPDSSTTADGGADNDTINLGDPQPGSGSLNDLQGTVTVNGGSNGTGTRQLRTGEGSVSPSDPYESTSQFDEDSAITVDRGDTLNLNDDSETANTRYDVELGAGQVARNGTTLANVSNIELANLTGGSGEDDVLVMLPSGGFMGAQTVFTFDGMAGDDALKIMGSSQADSVIVQDLRTDASPRSNFEIANVECLHLAGGNGNDNLINDTGGGSASSGSSVPSLIEGGAGDDILLGGNDLDVLFGGAGVDALFGGEGDDYLFADLDKDGTQNVANQELLVGGGGDDSGVGSSDGTSGGDDIIIGVEGMPQSQQGMFFIMFPRETAAAPTAADINDLRQEALAAFAARGCDDDWSSTAGMMHNGLLPMDTNNDGEISPSDVLVIVNHLNASGSQSVAEAASGLQAEGEGGTRFYYPDTNGDGEISPLDALLVINVLNSFGGSVSLGGTGLTAEGESSGGASTGFSNTAAGFARFTEASSMANAGSQLDAGVGATDSVSTNAGGSPSASAAAFADFGVESNESLDLAPTLGDTTPRDSNAEESPVNNPLDEDLLDSFAEDVAARWV
ncbi:MAG: hypothetical protein KDA47_14155, partial [Planctomycetales bacterium]|nr:hypothetical protein [Planctomycetales bacterium]